MSSFTAEQRRALARALADDGDDDAPLVCPACGGAVNRRAVTRPEEVPYVRHRVWLLCAGCRRSGAIDLPHD